MQAIPLLAVLALAVGANGVVRLWSLARRDLLAEQVSRVATLRLVDAAGSVPLVAFEQPEFFDVVERARMSGSVRSLQVVNGLTASATALFGCVAVLVTLLTIAPAIVPILALGAIPLMFAASRNNVAYYQFVRGITGTERRRDYFVEILTRREPAAEVRAYGLFAFFRERYARAQAEVLQGLDQNLRERLRRSVRGELSVAALLVAALALMTYLYAHEIFGLSEAVVVLFGVVQLRAALTELAFQTAELHEASLFLRDFAALPAACASVPALRTPSTRLRALELSDVTFRYPGVKRPALAAVSLRVERGEIIGVVGENGSGKTTLAKVLAGLYEPQSGTVAWNDGSAVPRAEVALLLQDFGRYALTVAENIRLGDLDGTDVETAGAAAGVDETIRGLPSGYRTLLGRTFGGHELSGGHWQRVALARALARDASLVILDEPTAALDPRAEADLYRRARALFADRGLVLVAHRFAAVRDADRIVVLEGGRVVDSGDHDSLMTRGGLYAELFELQAHRFRHESLHTVNA